jgi:hypothetical protein
MSLSKLLDFSNCSAGATVIEVFSTGHVESLRKELHRCCLAFGASVEWPIVAEPAEPFIWRFANDCDMDDRCHKHMRRSPWTRFRVTGRG